MRYIKILHHIYHKYIKQRNEEARFLILLSFLVTFLITRLIVYGITFDFLPPFIFKDTYFHNMHIHHLVYGILLLLIAGFIRIPQFGQKLVRISSVLYGIGAALTLDEFSLWLRFNPNAYFGRQGRISIDAVLIFTLFIVMAIFYGEFWKRVFVAIFSAKKFKRRLKFGMIHK